MYESFLPNSNMCAAPGIYIRLLRQIPTLYQVAMTRAQGPVNIDMRSSTIKQTKSHRSCPRPRIFGMEHQVDIQNTRRSTKDEDQVLCAFAHAIHCTSLGARWIFIIAKNNSSKPASRHLTPSSDIAFASIISIRCGSFLLAATTSWHCDVVLVT